MEYLQENFPIIAVLIFVLKDPIIKIIGARFPLAFSAWIENRTDWREFDQEKDALLLKEKLNASEFERKQYANREKEYIKILKGMVDFSQQVLTKQLDGVEINILTEIRSIKTSLDNLSREHLNG